MSQRCFTSADFVSDNDGTIPDTVLDQADLDTLKEITGIPNVGRSQRRFREVQNISDTANEKAELMRKLNIKPELQSGSNCGLAVPVLPAKNS